jgi:hypothetical protein
VPALAQFSRQTLGQAVKGMGEQQDAHGVMGLRHQFHQLSESVSCRETPASHARSAS